jgi:hypothetical protein
MTHDDDSPADLGGPPETGESASVPALSPGPGQGFADSEPSAESAVLDEGGGAVASAFVMEAVSEKSPTNHLDLFDCAAVSAPGYEGEIR